MRASPHLALSIFYAVAAAVVAGIHMRSYAHTYIDLYHRTDTSQLTQAVQLSTDFGIAAVACWFVISCTAAAIRMWLDPDRTE